MLSHEELHSMYRSPNIVRVTKSMRFRLVDHLTIMKESWKAFKIYLETVPYGEFYEGVGVGGRKILQSVSIWEIRLILLRIGILGEPL